MNAMENIVGKEKMLAASIFSFPTMIAKPHGSVSNIADFRTGGCWFDPRLGQHSFPGLMIVIATGFIPLSLLSVVSAMESSQWLGKNIEQSTGLKNSRKAWIGVLAAVI